MKNCLILPNKTHTQGQFSNLLEETLKEGARRLLQQAIEMEVEEYIQSHRNETDSQGKRRVIRNGYLPEREIQTGLGKLPVKQPRVRDKEGTQSFVSSILPPYLRRTPSLDSLIPALYLKGVSTGDMSEALKAILGDSQGLSATNVTRLKLIWEAEYGDWQKRSLEDKRYVYIWADGIYFNIRLSDDRPCFLVIIGALPCGKKELVAIHSGFRESKISWLETLQDLKARGMETPPELAVGDGALGFWPALEEVFPGTRQQRCWVHKTANILDKLPKSQQPGAKEMIHEMYMSATKEEGLKAFEKFLRVHEAKYPKACECLAKDKEQLFTFYDFPAMHWQHIRTTNPIESTFATVRHRTRLTKGCGSVRATLMMVYKVASEAEKKWRRLRGYELIKKVIRGIRFKDGEEVVETEKKEEIVA